MALTEPAVTWQNLWRGSATEDIAGRALLDGEDLDAVMKKSHTCFTQAPDLGFRSDRSVS